MIEGYPHITKRAVITRVASFVRESQGFPLGGFYDGQELAENPQYTESYRILYRNVVESVKRLSGEKPVYHAIWEINHRPVLAVSNHPVPQEPKDLEEWKVDVASLVHVDVVKNTFGYVDEPYEDVDGFLHGQGAADERWNLVPSSFLVASAPPNLNAVMLAYATEEEGGGADIVELVRNGFKPRVSLCADGGPIQDDNPNSNALISIVPRAKGVLRADLDIETGYTGVHSARPWNAPLPSIPSRMRYLQNSLAEIEGETFDNPAPDNYMGRTWNITTHQTDGSYNETPSRGNMKFEIRSGDMGNIMEGEEILIRLAKEYGFTYRRNPHNGLLAAFYQDPTVNEVQLFAQAAGDAAGKERVIYQNDFGSMDNRHLPIDVVRITHGIRSDHWHTKSLAEKVSIEAIMAYINIYIRFVNNIT